MGVMGKEKMIKTYRGLVGIIKRKIIDKYDSFSLIHDMEYQLKWLGGHKVSVSAWQEKMGATINNVDFVVLMSKELMRNQESKLYEWIFNKEQNDKIYNWLYQSGEVHREFEKRERKRSRKLKFL